MQQADQVLDVGDAGCGGVVAISQALLGLPEGAVLEVRSTDATMGYDLEPWARLCGHQYLGQQTENGVLRCFVRKGGPL